MGAQTFLSEQQALDLVFPTKGEIRTEERQLAPDERGRLQKESSLRFPEKSYKFLVNRVGGRVDGYALVLNEIGKSEPITFMVGMDAAGRVRDVGLMVFRESRGWEVRERRFMNQFRGKRASDPLRVNQDVLNYTGATLSSQAIARGVKRALLLVKHFYGAPLPQAGRACVRPAFARVEPLKELRWVMGSPARITVYAASETAGRRAIEAGFAELERLDAMLSDYQPSSELSRVNREADVHPVRVSPEHFALLEQALEVSRRTGGAFDITVGALLRGGSSRCVGYRNVVLDQHAHTVRFACPGTELDLGGIGKGYAAQRAARVLERHGIRRALINLGGSSFYALGPPPGGRAWQIAIEDTGEIISLLPGHALSTSGNYRRAHVLDPATGRPAPSGRIATVVCASGALSDALTKPLLLREHFDLNAVAPGAAWLVLQRR